MSSQIIVAARRRDAARTKDAILRAAQATFSSCGYAQTGLREIAAMAGINQALIVRYFGSKEALFEVALADALSLDNLLAAPRERFGEHVARLLLREPEGADSTAMMVLATADAGTRAIVVRLLEERVIEILAQWLGAPDAKVRAAQITILCTGFVTYRRLLPLPETAEPAAVHWLARALQAIVDA